MEDGPLFPLSGHQPATGTGPVDHPQTPPSSYPSVGPAPTTTRAPQGHGSTRTISIVAAAVVAVAGIASATYVLTSRSSQPTQPAADTSAGSVRTPHIVTSTADVPMPMPAVAPPAAIKPSPHAVTATIVGTCDEGGSCGVKQRTAPFSESPRMYQDDLFDGAAVALACQTTGDVRASSGHGSSAVWYRLDNGSYVNSVYLNADPASVPAC